MKSISRTFEHSVGVILDSYGYRPKLTFSGDKSPRATTPKQSFVEVASITASEGWRRHRLTIESSFTLIQDTTNISENELYKVWDVVRDDALEILLTIGRMPQVVTISEMEIIPAKAPSAAGRSVAIEASLTLILNYEPEED